MNTIERRVSDALHEQVDELPLSTTDLAQLQRELHRRAHAPQSRQRLRTGSRTWQLAVAACAVTAVVLGALALRSDPEPPKLPAAPPPISLTDLAGIWRVDDEDTPWLWTFTTDGRVTHVDTAGAWMDDDLQEWTLRPAPGGFTEVSPDAVPCQATWATAISRQGRMLLHVTAATPTCGVAPSPDVWDFTRISPPSAASTTMSSNWGSSDASVVTQTGQVMGTWLFPATGTLLAIDTSGDYTVSTFDTLNRPETGTVAVTGAGSLVFTPASNPTCTAVFTSVTSRNSTLAATVADESCTRLTGATDTWLRLN